MKKDTRTFERMYDDALLALPHAEFSTRMRAEADATQEIERVRESHGSTPRHLVDASKPKRAILHNSFDWDDGSCGIKFRNVQARQIMNGLEVVYLEQAPDGTQTETIKVPALVSMSSSATTTGGREYIPIQTVMEDDELRDRLLDRAKREIVAWQTKYAHLTELAALHTAITKALAKVA